MCLIASVTAGSKQIVMRSVVIADITETWVSAVRTDLRYSILSNLDDMARDLEKIGEMIPEFFAFYSQLFCHGNSLPS